MATAKVMTINQKQQDSRAVKMTTGELVVQTILEMAALLAVCVLLTIAVRDGEWWPGIVAGLLFIALTVSWIINDGGDSHDPY
jgi:L-asparagine transporter-like permease